LLSRWGAATAMPPITLPPPLRLGLDSQDQGRTRHLCATRFSAGYFGLSL